MRQAQSEGEVVMYEARRYVGLPDAPRPLDTSYAPYVSKDERVMSASRRGSLT
jgi:hypothetical protein